MKKQDVIETPEPATPDTLMEHFRGKGLTSMILFTLLVHVVVVFGFSIPFFLSKVRGTNTATMTKEERLDQAVREATVKLRALAETYNLSPQDISQQFSGGGTRTKAAPVKPPPAKESSTTAQEKETPVTQQPEKPKSAIEKEIEVSKPGPKEPAVENDPFK